MNGQKRLYWTMKNFTVVWLSGCCLVMPKILERDIYICLHKLLEIIYTSVCVCICMHLYM